ncbi:hypothetical protein JAAARDRAFT_210608 [Jaapia argillacea MUCL 33604]|uniref:Phytocyanin domain-containing protein n=1 Tax=Jaapia argillacea MUCL 33604 TaxID=933084 RepID=A0A067PMC8_9AGAM|nr:hypothetical protein JAAARDRAFT_210608 [Jaapia argillacea MUCL 33604]
MSPKSLALWSLAFSAHILSVLGQTTHTVYIGTSLIFYDPPTLSAQVNDTITFVFAAGIHGVTQSSFSTPCVALPGGFNSGLVGPGSNSSAPTLQWDLVLTDGSNPIWFFCQNSRPESHCAAGMVGVINPPSNDMWSSYIAAAKSVTGTPAPTTTPALQGVGAYAIQTPTPVVISTKPTSDATAISALSSFFIPPTSSPSPSATHSASKKAPIGAIVGGVVGGVVVLSIIGVLSFLLWRAQRKSEVTPTPYGGQRTFDPTPMDENKGFVTSGAVPVRDSTYTTTTTNPTSPGGPGYYNRDSIYSTQQPPLHYDPHQAPPIPQMQQHYQQFSPPGSPALVPVQMSSISSKPPQGYPGSPGSEYSNVPNIRDIASEVVQMLRQEGLGTAAAATPPAGGAGSGGVSGRPGDRSLPNVPEIRDAQSEVASSDQHLAVHAPVPQRMFSPGPGPYPPSYSA